VRGGVDYVKRTTVRFSSGTKRLEGRNDPGGEIFPERDQQLVSGGQVRRSPVQLTLQGLVLSSQVLNSILQLSGFFLLPISVELGGLAISLPANENKRISSCEKKCLVSVMGTFS